MGSIAKQFINIWKKLGVNQKLTVILLGTGMIAGMTVLGFISQRPSYELLYADLEEKEMAEVVAFLKDSKVPYRVVHGGRAVMVPEGSKYDLRLSMAGQDIATDGRVGLELWESPGWGASPLAERMMKRRAIQGELARTISHLENVAWADVQIAQPEETLFAEEQQPVTAAITLKLEMDHRLRPAQVAAVCRLVAGSVEGLSAENVTVIDDQGNLLTAPHGDDATAIAADAQAYRKNYEEYLARKAQTLLDRALGAGRGVVEVSAVLDMDRISETREEYDAENRVAVTEKLVSSSSEGGQSGAGESSETVETAYQVPRSVRTIESVPGAVKRLHVAVMLDPTTEGGAEGETETMSQQQIEELSLALQHAVGLDQQTRQDTFQLTAMEFHQPDTPTPEEPIETAKDNAVLEIVKQASPVAAVLIFVVFASIVLKRLGRASAPEAEKGADEQMFPIGMNLDLDGDIGGNGQGQTKLRNRVKEAMAKDPAAAARLLQQWLSEEDSMTKDANRG